MKLANKYFVNVLSVGFVTLVTLSVLLFWGREACQAFLYSDILDKPLGYVDISPIALTPDLDSDPNVVQKSHITASMSEAVVFSSLGFWQNIYSLERGDLGRFFIYHSIKDSENKNIIIFDKRLGQFVCYEAFKERGQWVKKVIAYAGPKGVSKTADKNLGRFTKPIRGQWKPDPLREGNRLCFMFFDNKLRNFFQINFERAEIITSPKVPEGYRLVQISRNGKLEKGQRQGEKAIQDFMWEPPLRIATAQDKIEGRRIFVTDSDGQRVGLASVEKNISTYYSKEFSLVIDGAGEIRRLDNETLELSEPIAYLSSPLVFGRGEPVGPRDVFAYEVSPFVRDGQFSGTILCSVSKEAIGLRIAVFDKDGELIENEGANVLNSSNKAGGPLLFVIEYLLENLQPAFFSMTSYFTANCFEATSGHRALFVLPNSFVGMIRRDSGDSVIGRFLFVLFIVLAPSLILGIGLARLVRKDATVIGLSKRAKRYWTIGTILFGISAYITYRLTRPKETLVTCQNCGKLRRPDMLACHNCGGKWQITELTAPAWRVIDEAGKQVAS